MNDINGPDSMNSGADEDNGNDDSENGESSFGSSAEISHEEFEALGRETAELRDKCDKYLRSVAELENIKRRLEREKIDALKYGGEPVLRDLLPVLDGLDKAFAGSVANNGKDKGKDKDKGKSAVDVDAFLEGFAMVRKQLLDMLARHGLEEISSIGLPFDPHLHQAIQRVEGSDVSVDMVHEEYAKGYLLHGRLLRPAIVSVRVPAGS